jgi:DNA-binding transcriptional regulator YiaG
VSPEEYKALRERLGSQARVARALGVHRVTLAKREVGMLPIDREAAYALRWLDAHRGLLEP